MLPTLIVFGDRTANEVVEAAKLASPNIFGSIERLYYEEPSFTDVHLPKYSQGGMEVYYNIGIADVRIKLLIEARCQQVGWRPHTVVHPSAVISPSARLGPGTFVGPLAVISTNSRVGAHCIVHLGSSVGHDVSIGDCCAILPGARISGMVKIGERVLVGSNAFVNAGVKIGNDSQIDALTYVSRDLQDGHLLSVRSKGALKRIARDIL